VAVGEGLTWLAPDPARVHLVRVTTGRIAERDLVTAEVDQTLRDATRRHHTATHLLHAALRTVLGPHVKQAGSLVSPDRLRFDFVHYAALSAEEIERIEQIVNRAIVANAPVQTEVRATEEAIAAGAMALFGEKYGDRVRVVSVPGVSVELCGGTHCRATGDIGSFTIVQESGIAAGVRRIEAVTGEVAVAYHQARRRALDQVTRALTVPADQAGAAIERLQAEVKRLTKEAGHLRVALAMAQAPAGSTRPVSASTDAAEPVGDAAMIVAQVSGLDKVGLRSLADSHRDRIGRGVVVLASDHDEKVSLVVSVTRDLTDRIKAGQIVKAIAPIVNGGGGGRPDFAEAGGKTTEKIGDMLDEARRLIRQQLAG
jgi:alanyl-tRNA synthetase